MPKDVDFFRKEYKKQKILENIVNTRVLNRPKIKKWQVAIVIAILPFLLGFLIYICLATQRSLALKLIFLQISIIFIFEIYIRFCLVCVVKCYQAYAKRETRKRCKCVPSCSQYAVLSLKRVFPLVLALLKIRKRLYVTCDGEDYVLDYPTKRLNRKHQIEI